MAQEEQIKTYAIPDNFIDESRIINGMFKTRNFIEGVVMALLVAIPALFIPADSLNVRIMIIVGIGAPFFLLGNAGFNGDAISTTLLHYRKWRKERGVMIYRNDNRFLKTSPLDDMLNTPLPRDKIMDALDAFKEARRRRAGAQVLIEGETFEFEEDSNLEYLYVEDKEKATVTEVVEVGSAKPREPEFEVIEGDMSPAIEVVNADSQNEELSISMDDGFDIFAKSDKEKDDDNGGLILDIDEALHQNHGKGSE